MDTIRSTRRSNLAVAPNLTVILFMAGGSRPVGEECRRLAEEEVRRGRCGGRERRPTGEEGRRDGHGRRPAGEEPLAWRVRRGRLVAGRGGGSRAAGAAGGRQGGAQRRGGPARRTAGKERGWANNGRGEERRWRRTWLRRHRRRSLPHLRLASSRSPLYSTGGDSSGRPRVLLNLAALALVGGGDTSWRRRAGREAAADGEELGVGGGGRRLDPASAVLCQERVAARPDVEPGGLVREVELDTHGVRKLPVAVGKEEHLITAASSETLQTRRPPHFTPSASSPPAGCGGGGGGGGGGVGEGPPGLVLPRCRFLSSSSP
ncbi:hypothetical protein [Oryza sativa Japonica Group]|uniref:Uncharacterized protein n=2 Tax=Oryza sativa subsp. japonica TaxID=39947 RepID=Q5JM70_ORYSJ|nr:hypothetical protein [Oryza sativa Japonica Group]BAD87795.1 hypothetical protein [Oryza sativa Japonica Group]